MDLELGEKNYFFEHEKVVVRWLPREEKYNSVVRAFGDVSTGNKAGDR